MREWSIDISLHWPHNRCAAIYGPTEMQWHYRAIYFAITVTINIEA